MRTVFLIALTSLFVFAKCNKDDSGTVSANFFPTTTGSTWTYKENVANVQYTYTATAKDTTINSKTYKVVNNSLGGNVYAAQVSSDYYRYGALQTGFNSSTGIEELFLKDNVALNGTWETTQNVVYNGTTYPLKLSYKITEVNATKTYVGKTYTSVTKVRLDISTTQSGFAIVLGGGDFFYANGVGLVHSELAINAPGQPAISQNTDLLTYSIK